MSSSARKLQNARRSRSYKTKNQSKHKQQSHDFDLMMIKKNIYYLLFLIFAILVPLLIIPSVMDRDKNKWLNDAIKISIFVVVVVFALSSFIMAYALNIKNIYKFIFILVLVVLSLVYGIMSGIYPHAKQYHYIAVSSIIICFIMISVCYYSPQGKKQITRQKYDSWSNQNFGFNISVLPHP